MGSDRQLPRWLLPGLAVSALLSLPLATVATAPAGSALASSGVVSHPGLAAPALTHRVVAVPTQRGTKGSPLSNRQGAGPLLRPSADSHGLQRAQRSHRGRRDHCHHRRVW
jgi:hypothetical protein